MSRFHLKILGLRHFRMSLCISNPCLYFFLLSNRLLQMSQILQLLIELFAMIGVLCQRWTRTTTTEEPYRWLMMYPHKPGMFPPNVDIGFIFIWKKHIVLKTQSNSLLVLEPPFSIKIWKFSMLVKPPWNLGKHDLADN